MSLEPRFLLSLDLLLLYHVSISFGDLMSLEQTSRMIVSGKIAVSISFGDLMSLELLGQSVPQAAQARFNLLWRSNVIGTLSKILIAWTVLVSISFGDLMSLEPDIEKSLDIIGASFNLLWRSNVIGTPILRTRSQRSL